jgi:hypothetical protein
VARAALAARVQREITSWCDVIEANNIQAD